MPSKSKAYTNKKAVSWNYMYLLVSALLAIPLLILFQLRSGDIDLHYQIFEFDIIFR